MIVNPTPNGVEVNDIDDATSFYMELTPEAIEILSASLYKDRIMAPIRELGANAYDSHVESKKADVPFEVKVPTSIDPTFKIRDYGTGIDPKNIKKVYTGYFVSSKKDSNDYIGCMGLGSKSPFAYNNETFNVTSFWNGKAYFYSCYKDKENKPVISLMGSDETSELNGLEVSFAVKSEDFYTFKQKVAEAFAFYKVKPVVKGGTIKFNEYEYIIKNEKFGVLKSSSYSSSKIVMGNVAYSLDESAFSFNSEQSRIIQHGLHLFVPIGSVKVAASRETLSFDESTKDYVISVLNDVIDEIKKEVNKNVDNIDNIWDAKIYCNSLKNSVLANILHNRINEFYINWKGHKTYGYFNLKEMQYAKNSSIESICLSDGSRSYGSAKVSMGLRRTILTNIYPNSSVVLFINDVNHGEYAAIKRFLEANPQTSSVVLIPSLYSQNLIEELCIPKDQVKKVSEIEKPPRKPREARDPSLKTMFNTVKGSQFVTATVDIDEDNGIVFEQRYNEIKIDKDQLISLSDFQSIQNNLSCLGFKDAIYTVRTADLKKLEDFPNFENGVEKVRKFLEKQTQIEENIVFNLNCAKPEMAIHINRLKGLLSSKNSNGQTLGEVVPEFKIIQELFDDYNRINSNDKSYPYKSLVNIFLPGRVYTSKVPFKYTGVFDGIYSKFPLLEYLNIEYSFSMNKKKTDEIFKYLKLISDLSVVSTEEMRDAV